MMFKTLKASLLALACVATGSVLAHKPLFECYKGDNNKIECEGGFSDGSSAKGIKIIAFSYDEEELWSGALDDKSQVVLDRPEGEFFIRFDGGRGHSVDVDHNEIN